MDESPVQRLAPSLVTLLARLPGCPAWLIKLATLFQPELHTDGVHPVIRGFARAAVSAGSLPAR
jgi:hypothetical protein